MLSNYNGIQISVYPAWDYGFWPKKKPNSIDEFNFNVDGLSELVNWGVENNMYLIHHCLFFPNKYFPKWFWETNYTSDELNKILDYSFIFELTVQTELIICSKNCDKLRLL